MPAGGEARWEKSFRCEPGRIGPDIWRSISMCRNIRTLYNFDPPATQEEIRAAALQYVRKISGFTKPSIANETAFEAAVDEISRISAELLSSLETNATPRDRDVEAAKARARSIQRFGS
jgi:hypothetical protein